MKVLLYLFVVLTLSSLIGTVSGQLVALIFVSDDIGLFVGLFVFVGLVWASLTAHKSNVKRK